jgi:peptidoglycan/xylan/chitin deacetylase (PgdA/CDA1 family)
VAISSGSAGSPIPAGEILHGPRTRRWVALTFDADMTRAMLAQERAGRIPGSWYDGALFDELRATHTPATIFLTGLWTERHRAAVRRLAADPGIELANHTMDHSAFAQPCFGLPGVSSDHSRRAEVVQARRVIARASGVNPRFFRFPGGCARSADVALVHSQGEQPVLWDVVSGDAFQHDPGVIVRAVLGGVRPGSIVVAHCIGAPNTPATAAAMHVIIPALRARGYRFVTLSALLAPGR